MGNFSNYNNLETVICIFTGVYCLNIKLYMMLFLHSLRKLTLKRKLVNYFSHNTNKKKMYFKKSSDQNENV